MRKSVIWILHGPRISPARIAGLICQLLVALLLVGSSTALAAGPPVVEGESFSDVGSSSSTLSARVNAGGSPTTYEFEYGIGSTYGSATPQTSLGSASEAVSVLAQLGELQPETVYHFRIVVTNASGESARGADTAFSTLPLGILGLPDGRSYEIVSPAVNDDGSVYEPSVNSDQNANGGNGDNTTLPFQAAVNGDAVAYMADPGLTGGNGRQGTGFGNQYLATRSAEGGWTAVDIQPFGVKVSSYQAFSSDLLTGILTAGASYEPNIEPLSPEAPSKGYNVLYTYDGSDGGYHPLFTTAPPNRTPEEFEAYEVYQSGAGSRLAYAGASSNFEHLLFEANDALTSEAVDGGSKANNLYDSVGGRLRLVNVLPNGASEANATFGAPPSQISYYERGDNSPDFSHVISGDGTRIFWSKLDAEDKPEALYVRENDTQPESPLDAQGRCTNPADACTVQVDASQGPGSGGGGYFWTASSEGSKVFFTDESQLTGDSTAGPGAPDLYEYKVEGATGTLEDLTVDAQAGERADVEGVIGASEDGEYVYFVATGSLASGASVGQPNLYLSHGGVTTFVATLASNDDETWHVGGGSIYGDWRPGLGQRTAQVTPDGQRVAFASYKGLTNPLDDGVLNIYIYDADTGEISCASCNPSGAPSSDAEVPVSHSNTYMQRWVSEDGDRVFFDSSEALVPQDSNGKLNVYEWEQDGVGSCQRHGGCIYLLSGGTSTDNSYFADASTSGDDVFIVSRARLVEAGQGETFELYDARVGGVQSLVPPACSGAGCQGVPPAPPIFATPASVTFSGVGDFSPPTSIKSPAKPKPKARSLTRAQRLAKALRACAKEQKRKRAACRIQARKRYGAKAKTKVKKSAKGRK